MDETCDQTFVIDMTSPAETDHVILVDERNRALGPAGKLAAHQAPLLHRAFSVFLCDARGQILLQQRHPLKYHSGGLWANSCCGHPRLRERTKAAAIRRVGEELGAEVDLTFGFRTRYRTSFSNGLHENEIVYMYFGLLNRPIHANPTEIADLRFAPLEQLAHDVRRMPGAYTYWLRHYMEKHCEEIAYWIDRIAPQRSGPDR